MQKYCKFTFDRGGRSESISEDLPISAIRELIEKCGEIVGVEFEEEVTEIRSDEQDKKVLIEELIDNERDRLQGLCPPVEFREAHGCSMYGGPVPTEKSDCSACKTVYLTQYRSKYYLTFNIK